MIWLIRACICRLHGRWIRRHMRRHSPPLIAPPPPPPPIDPHTTTLRMHFATQQIPPGHTRPLVWHQYERIARAVRSEHTEHAEGA